MKHIFIACPWTPVGGGMFKVADYLIQGQEMPPSEAGVELQPLDTRGSGPAYQSAFFLARALGRLLAGRLGGDLVGVHVNMAERLSLIRKSILVAFCHLLGVPVVLHLHAAQLHHFYRSKARPVQALIRWVFSLPASVIVLGRAAEQFVTRELRVPAARVQIVINGVPEPVGVRRVEAVGRTSEILFLGSDWQRKGLFDLIEALALPGMRDRDFRLVVAGRGDREVAVARLTALGLADKVHFEGWADQATASRLLAAADVMVLPAYDEGLPLVILEALANAVAVVCTPVGEIPHFLQDGIHARFVTPGDTAGIAAALGTVLDDAGLRHRLETQGRGLYDQKFALGRFFSAIGAIHQKHFGRSASPRILPALPK